MPIANTRGEVIAELSSVDPDDKAFLDLAKKLKVLTYPKDVDVIRHLSYRMFCQWLYGLDPKLALFLTNDKKFSVIQRDVREKTWFHNVGDTLWRKWHGLDY